MQNARDPCIPTSYLVSRWISRGVERFQYTSYLAVWITPTFSPLLHNFLYSSTLSFVKQAANADARRCFMMPAT